MKKIVVSSLLMIVSCFCFGQTTKDSINEIKFRVFEKKGDSCFAKNDLKGAKKYWEKANAINPGVCRLQGQLCRFNNCQIHCVDLFEIREFIKSGDDFFQNKELNQAQKMYRETLFFLKDLYYGLEKDKDYFATKMQIENKLKEVDLLLHK